MKADTIRMANGERPKIWMERPVGKRVKIGLVRLPVANGFSRPLSAARASRPILASVPDKIKGCASIREARSKKATINRARGKNRL